MVQYTIVSLSWLGLILGLWTATGSYAVCRAWAQSKLHGVE